MRHTGGPCEEILAGPLRVYAVTATVSAYSRSTLHRLLLRLTGRVSLTPPHTPTICAHITAPSLSKAATASTCGPPAQSTTTSCARGHLKRRFPQVIERVLIREDLIGLLSLGGDLTASSSFVVGMAGSSRLLHRGVR